LPHRYLNASIIIARRAMSSAGWRKGEPPEPANEAKGEKHQLNTGSLVLHDGVAHRKLYIKNKEILHKK